MSATESSLFHDSKVWSSFSDADTQWALQNMQRVNVNVVAPDFSATIPTTFLRAGGNLSGPKLLFLHGMDSNALEWRYVIKKLNSLNCTSLDWWSGGWTDRTAITHALQAQNPPRPWDFIRNHILAFWQQHMGGEPIILVGTSLGGAVAIDFATQHPEVVAALVLVDAGGESFKSPDPDTVARFAPALVKIKSFAAWFQARAPSEATRVVALHRTEPLWREAQAEYYRSGSYKRIVDKQTIRQVAQPTLVIWGEDDPYLPVEDAYAFQRDLPNCQGVHVLKGSEHSPHLDQPAPVVPKILEFVRSLH